jgi:hypothetical protein
MALACPAGTLIRLIRFASYGTPAGACPAFTTSACNSATSAQVVAAACLNKQSCSVPATNASFGDPCVGTVKKLAVVVACSP